MISVIIPVHNQANLLIKTLVSLEKQTFKDFEVIVVDNNSNDNFNEVIAQYSRLSPPFSLSVVRSEGQMSDWCGVSKAVNKAGENPYYVVQPSADISPDYLDMLVNSPIETSSQWGGIFKKIKIGCVNDHLNILGGGTVHGFKFLEYLKQYYDIDVHAQVEPNNDQWMKEYLNTDIEGIRFFPYDEKNIRNYRDIFINISHWRIVKNWAKKKFAIVFFPQRVLPTFHYKFLANSKYTKSHIIDRWEVPFEDVDVVYPPIETESFPLKGKENIIFHVSRITRPTKEGDKGHIQMIETFKKMVDNGLSGWTFHLAGQVEDRKYYTKLLRMIQKYPIEFHVNKPFSVIQDLYGRAKIYWHLTGISLPSEPGAQEHFGMATVEAMAAGCVPVTLATGGQTEIVENRESGFLVKNVSELQTVTTEITQNEDLRELISTNAIKRARELDASFSRKKLFSVISRTDRVSIIVLCHNNLDFTKQCVSSLYQVTPPGFELILVDNASTDGGQTKEFIKSVRDQHDNVKCIFNKKNYGFATANNRAAKKAKGQHICYLNNDTELQWGWLERMIDVLEDDEKVGVVGARLYFPRSSSDAEWVIQHAGVYIDANCDTHHIGRFETDSNVPNFGVEEVECVTGAVMLVRKALARFNESYKRGYYEDNELCLSLREKGWKVCINHDAKLIHYEGTTQAVVKRKDTTIFNSITQQNRELFHKRWKNKLSSLPKIK